VLPIAGGVVAAVVLVLALVLIGHRHKTADVTISTPPPSETALVTTVPSTSPAASASPSAAPSATPAPSASAAPSAAPSGTPKPTAKPTPTPHPVREVSSVNCYSSADAKYCSKPDQAGYANGSFSTQPSNPAPTSYPDAATISMQSTASNSNIHVVVTVENKTQKTFHFPKREIDLVILKDNKSYDTLATHGDAFDMAPGTKMTGTFDLPVTQSGTYSWRAKTWYYVK